MQRRFSSAWPQLLLAGLASAIVMGSFILPLLRTYLSRSTTSSERRSANAGNKGSPSIGFSIERRGQISRGASGAVVLPGDRIRFSYSSEHDAQFGLLHLRRDHAGVYFPSGGPTTVRVAAGRDVSLDLTVELDNAAGFDHVFALFCDAPVSLEPVRAALEHDAELLDPPGCRVDSLTLQKKLQ